MHVSTDNATESISIFIINEYEYVLFFCGLQTLRIVHIYEESVLESCAGRLLWM